jgi:hypothetical protein
LLQQDIASPLRVPRAQAKLSFKERLHSQSSPADASAVLAARSGSAAAFFGRAGMKAARTINVRSGPVNQKMGIRRQVQAVAAAW